MIRTIILDDEPNNITVLESLLTRYCPDITIVGTSTNLDEGFDLINQSKPDLLFLDIQMPPGNAFSFLTKFPLISFEIIFVTAFESYALDAFRVSALDYLLKPVNIKSLQAAVHKAKARFLEKQTSSKSETVQSQANNEPLEKKKIALPTTNGFIFPSLGSILWLEASKNYTLVMLDNKDKVTVARTLGDFEAMLPPTNFSRVHHSFIVNHDHIKKYYPGRNAYLEMIDGTTISVSTRKKDLFMSKFT